MGLTRPHEEMCATTTGDSETLSNTKDPESTSLALLQATQDNLIGIGETIA
jgi:hypothetical protein